MEMLRVWREAAKVDRVDAFSGSIMNGRAFAYKATTMSKRSLRFTSEVVAQNILIDALSPFGLVPDRIETEKRIAFRDEVNLKTSGVRQRRTIVRPDFELHFGDSLVFCECKLAEGPMASADLAISDWGYNLTRSVDERIDLTSRIGNHYLALVPSRAPREDEIPALVDEAIMFIQNEHLDSYAGSYGTRVGAEYRRMAALDTVAAFGSSATPYVFVQPPARSTGGPGEAVYALIQTFSQAIKQSFSGLSHVWLLIGASPLPWKVEETVASFVQHVGDIAPFERVFIATSNESFMIADQHISPSVPI